MVIVTPTSQPFDPEEFFRFSATITRDPTADEARLRSAISRAYHATHLIARDRLFGLDARLFSKSVKKAIRRKIAGDVGSHALIIFAVSEKSKTVGQQLGQLKDARVIADYKLDQKHLAAAGKNSWRDYAEETLALASQVLPSVKRLPRY